MQPDRDRRCSLRNDATVEVPSAQCSHRKAAVEIRSQRRPEVCPHATQPRRHLVERRTAAAAVLCCLLRFEVLSQGPVAMAEGARVDYRLRLRGVPIRWQSEITAWCPPTLCVDGRRRGPFYLGSVPETGSPVRTWVRLVGLPQVAQATAAAGLGSLPSPAGGGRLGGLARPPRRRRVGPFSPRISGPCGSLVGPSQQFLRDLNGSVGVAPYRKRTGTQE